jgi:hypothetical protein
MAKYQILSPDGFTIEMDKAYYKSQKQALNSLTNWIERYRMQGYYSSRMYGRIDLSEIKNYCQFIKL